MKLCLLYKQQLFLFSGQDESVCEPELMCDLFARYQMIETSFTPKHTNPIDSQRCARLKYLIVKHCTTNGLPLIYNAEMQIWNFDLFVGISAVEDPLGDTLKGYIKLEGLFPGNCLNCLREISDNAAKVQIDIVAPITAPRLSSHLISTKEMQITGSYCADYSLKFPMAHFKNWKSFGPVSFTCTITVTIPDEILNPNYNSIPRSVRCETSHCISLPQKILDGEILSDLTIVANNGAVIKAHRSFLAVHSPVFLAMFQSDMEESRENTLQIPDMSEVTVRALLKYLYYDDIKEANESSVVAYELMHAGHMYAIEALEEKITKLVMDKPNNWFDADVAVKMFLLARRLSPINDELMGKAIQALKLSPEKLEQSSTYQELFEKDKEAARELCNFALVARWK